MPEPTTFTLLPGPPTTLVAATPGPDLAARGYTDEEHRVAGSGFATRAVVRRPASVDDFSGTLVVEWLNVSSGDDAAPDWTYLGEEVVRRGHVWVGVSAQFVGVEGGTSLVGDLPVESQNGLRRRDPERYGDLHHPGDAYCYLIYSAVASGLDAPGGPIEGWPVTVRLGIGESQSAFALVTYVNEVHPVDQVFDGFLIHSRGAATTGQGESGRGFDLDSLRTGDPVTIASDARVITVQTETDVVGRRFRSIEARQDDSPTFRLWEVAGSAHADLWQIGEFEELLGCPNPVNRGQQAYVVRAALRSLEAWCHDGVEPARADRLHVVDGALILDELGNALGGVRTPVVDAAVERLTGDASADASVLCSLFGRTLSVEPALIRERYTDPDGYLRAYEAATDAAIAAGFVLADDRDAVLAEARPDLVVPR